MTNTMKIPHKKIAPSLVQCGFTLVELMVAIVLGLLMTAAVIQSYLATKQTYRVTNGVATIQENARFSHYFLAKDLRNAGYSGCINQIKSKLRGNINDYNISNQAVYGWDHTGTDSKNTDYEFDSTLTIPNTSANDWSAALPLGLKGKVAAGSDVLRLKSFEELDIVLNSGNTNQANIGTVGAHGVPNNSILMVGNCHQVEMFHHLSNGNGAQSNLTAPEGNGVGDPGNVNPSGPVKWLKAYGPDDHVYGYVQTFYYVGEGASGLPSLFRIRTSDVAGGSSLLLSAEELVEGVETLQLLYGEDIDNDNNANRYISAHQVVDWNNIVSVKFGLLLRSPNSASDGDQQSTYTLLDNINFTHNGDDNVLRYVVNSTVKLRNLGLDKSAAVSISPSFP